MNLNIYTDCSVYKNSIGIGIIIVSENKILKTISRKIVCKGWNTDVGETIAVLYAINCIVNNPNIEHINILSDSMSLVYGYNDSIKYTKKSKMKTLVELVKDNMKSNMDLLYIAGHTGNKFNTAADKAAKNALKL